MDRNRKRCIDGTIPVLNGPCTLVSFGLIALDVVAQLPDFSLFDKYGLPHNDQVVIPTGKFHDLFDEIKNGNYNLERCSGGSAQNVTRIFQRIYNVPHSTLMFGMTGDDEKRDLVKRMTEEDGVITRYYVEENIETLTIIILACGHKRTGIGMTDMQSISLQWNLYPSTEERKMMANCKFLQTDGYFVLYHGFPELKELLTFSSDLDSTVFVFNLGAKFVIELKPKLTLEISEKADIVISNTEEFEQLIRSNHLEGDSQHMSVWMKRIHNTMLEKHNCESKLQPFKKILVVTDGQHPVHCIYGDPGQIVVYEVPEVRADLIVDTSGAGDAFVAGFLYGLMNNFDIHQILKFACEIAAVVLQRPGVCLKESDFRNIIIK